jgi:hypothetical protein
MTIFAESLYTSLIWSTLILPHLTVALLMQYVDSVTDVLFCDIPLIGDGISISSIGVAIML